MQIDLEVVLDVDDMALDVGERLVEVLRPTLRRAKDLQLLELRAGVEMVSRADRHPRCRHLPDLANYHAPPAENAAGLAGRY